MTAKQSPMEIFRAIKEANPDLSVEQLTRKFEAKIAGDKEVQSAIIGEVFGNFLAAHDHLDITDFDMSSEVIPMVMDWCEDQTEKQKAKPFKKRRRK